MAQKNGDMLTGLFSGKIGTGTYESGKETYGKLCKKITIHYYHVLIKVVSLNLEM